MLQTDVDITAKAEKRGDSVYLQQTVGVELEEGKKKEQERQRKILPEYMSGMSKLASMSVADFRIHFSDQVTKVNSSDNLEETAIQYLTIISAHSTELYM